MSTDERATGGCPVCQAGETTPVLDLGMVPVHCNVLWQSREAALGAPKGALQVAFCTECGHVFNESFDPALTEYSEQYENSLHFSPRFQQYATALAERLADEFDLAGKTVIEIGCGQGDFLRLLCQAGGCRGIGFDPSYVPDADSDTPDGPGLELIQDFYSDAYSSYAADLVCCRHVLEHVPELGPFLETIRNAIRAQGGAAVFFEVPNVVPILRDGAIWDLIYEHPSYFSPSSLARLFASSGFATRSVEPAFGGQYLVLRANVSEEPETEMPRPVPTPEELGVDVGAFAQRYAACVTEWRDRLRGLDESGATVVAWGGGSKGVTFLNAMAGEAGAEYVVDVNPRKRGRFVPGTGQEVISPQDLQRHHPDTVIVMNPIYLAEIRETLDELGISAQTMAVWG